MSDRPVIYIPDATYANPDYQHMDEVEASRFFLDKTSKKFQLSGREANIDAGADWPAVALEAIEYIKERDVRDVLLVGIALFFCGKKINDNLDAWLSIGQKLTKSLKNCRYVLNRSASILFVLFKYSKDSRTSIQNIQLHQYECLDGRFIHSLNEVKIAKRNFFANQLEEQYLGGAIHYFRITINDFDFEILTRGNSILIRKLKNEKE